MSILIDHLPATINESDVATLMRQYGRVSIVKFIGDDRSDHSGSCLVTMSDNSKVGMDFIVKRLDGHFWKGAQLTVHSMLYG